MEKSSLTGLSQLAVIGGSAGSIEALLKILPQLATPSFLSFVLVLHRRNNSNDSSMQQLFASKSRLNVREINDKEDLFPDTIYLAPADYHVLFEKDRLLSLDDSEKVNYSRPSIDVAFESAAEIWGQKLIAVLLSGANTDGVEGLKKVKEKGGLIIVQDPLTAAVPYMPRQALLQLTVDHVFDENQIAGFFNGLHQS